MTVTVRARGVATIAACALLAGCGGAGGGTPARPAPPRPPGDYAHPRVEGLWRVVIDPSRGNIVNPDRRTDNALASCPAGACSFRLAGIRFVFDDIIGDYRATVREKLDCVRGSSDEVIVANGYRARTRYRITVRSSIVRMGVRRAIRMRGRFVADVRRTDAAVAAYCKDTPNDSGTFTAVREDLPAASGS